MKPASATSAAATPTHQARRSAGQPRASHSAAPSAKISDVARSVSICHHADERVPSSRASSPATPPPRLAPTMKLMPDQNARPASAVNSQPAASDSIAAAWRACLPPVSSVRCTHSATSAIANTRCQASQNATRASRPRRTQCSGMQAKVVSSAAAAPSSTRSHGCRIAIAMPTATTASKAAAPCIGRSRNKPNASEPPPTSNAGTASCSTKSGRSFERRTTSAAIKTRTPMRYGPTPRWIRSPSSIPTTPSKGTAASQAPSPVSSTTGQGRASCAGRMAPAGKMPAAMAACSVRSKRSVLIARPPLVRLDDARDAVRRSPSRRATRPRSSRAATARRSGRRCGGGRTRRARFRQRSRC